MYHKHDGILIREPSYIDYSQLAIGVTFSPLSTYPDYYNTGGRNPKNNIEDKEKGRGLLLLFFACADLETSSAATADHDKADQIEPSPSSASFGVNASYFSPFEFLLCYRTSSCPGSYRMTRTFPCPFYCFHTLFVSPSLASTFSILVFPSKFHVSQCSQVL